MCPKRKIDSYRDYVLDQLRSLEDVSCRSMFGGYGLYLGADFFGIVYDGRLYFKTDETTREKYRDRGMGPFAPSEKQVLKSYYEVPEEIVEDDEQLASWAREAAARKKKRKAARGGGGGETAGGEEGRPWLIGHDSSWTMRARPSHPPKSGFGATRTRKPWRRGGGRKGSRA